MESKADGAEQAHINQKELLARLENDRELLREIVEIFREDFPRYAEELRTAVKRENAAEVMRAAHTLKGMLANFAARRAAAAVAKLEELGKSGEMGQLAVAMEEFEKEAAGIMPELETVTKEERR